MSDSADPDSKSSASPDPASQDSATKDSAPQDSATKGSGTKSRILDCACELLVAGDERFSLRAVARRAGVSIGTLQYHYPDKKGLMDACVDLAVYDHFNELAKTFKPKFSAAGGKDEFIAESVRFGFRYACDNLDFIRILENSYTEMGGLDLGRTNATLKPFLANASMLLGAGLNLSPQEVQLRANTVLLLIGRYSIMSESAMENLFASAEGTSAKATIEDHLVAVAISLFS
jgi:AcrR family transcriptional regulator